MQNFLDPRMTSALCAPRHGDNHILYTLAQQQISKRAHYLWARVYKEFTGGGGGLSDGMKKNTYYALED